MYFSNLPNIEYSEKPIRFPISDKQYVLAKNIFRKYKIREKSFQDSIFFNKYTIEDGERLDTIAAKVYGSSEYDWVIMLANNIVDPYSDLPIRDSNLYDFVAERYGNPEGIHHYETREVKDSLGRVVLKEGLHVDSTFYNAPAYEVDTSPSLPQQTLPVQASATCSIVGTRISTIPVVSQGSGYETPPSVLISSTVGVGASASANLSSTGYVKRLEITNPGAGYTLPPIVTLGGGLAGQSATAEITNGSVTNITLDGVKFDTTNSDQIYEFSSGTTIAPNGTGIGDSGGFNIGSTHLRFGESSGERYVILNPINATAINTVRVYAIRGNGSNGGETPDINGVEDLYIQYQITNPGDAPDPNAWQQLGIVIDAVPNGTGTGVLDNYDFDLTGSPVQAENVYFRLYQPGNSGPQFDHYGILSVTFIGDASVEIADATITLEKNPLQITDPTVDATASIILGKRVESVTVDNPGSGYTVSNTSIALTGGSFVTTATVTLTIASLLGITLNNSGSGYSTATISLVGGDGSGATAGIVVNNNSVQSVSITNQGNGNYTIPPDVSISAPDNVILFSQDQIYTEGLTTWKWNGSNWLKQISTGFQYYNNGTVVSVPGNTVSVPVTNYQYEMTLNEKRREIFLLRPELLERFVSEFENLNEYSRSTDYINRKTKKSN